MVAPSEEAAVQLINGDLDIGTWQSYRRNSDADGNAEDSTFSNEIASSEDAMFSSERGSQAEKEPDLSLASREFPNYVASGNGNESGSFSAAEIAIIQREQNSQMEKGTLVHDSSLLEEHPNVHSHQGNQNSHVDGNGNESGSFSAAEIAIIRREQKSQIEGRGKLGHDSSASEELLQVHSYQGNQNEHVNGYGNESAGFSAAEIAIIQSEQMLQMEGRGKLGHDSSESEEFPKVRSNRGFQNEYAEGNSNESAGFSAAEIAIIRREQKLQTVKKSGHDSSVLDDLLQDRSNQGAQNKDADGNGNANKSGDVSNILAPSPAENELLSHEQRRSQEEKELRSKHPWMFEENPTDRFYTTFEKRFKELVAFQETHGHCNPPANITSLGIWCARMRQGYRNQKNGKVSKAYKSLTSEQIERLESIGFQWAVQKSKFDRRVKELAAFKKIHGHFQVPARGNNGLGAWWRNVRSSYKRLQRGEIPKTGEIKMTPERIKALEEVGFLKRCPAGQLNVV